MRLKKHLLFYCGVGRNVEIPSSASAEEYGEIRADFEKNFDEKTVWSDFFTLDDNFMVNCFYFEEHFVCDGAIINLFIFPDHKRKDIDKAITKLRHERDIVKINKIIVKKFI